MFGHKNVNCLDCGVRFDIKYGAFFVKESDGYVCPACHQIRVKKEKKAAKEAAAREREEKTGMRQTEMAMNLKIIFGLITIVVTSQGDPREAQWSLGYYLFGILVGGALIAWGVEPYFKAKKKMEERKMEQLMSKPLESFGDLELEALQKKYDEDRKK